MGAPILIVSWAETEAPPPSHIPNPTIVSQRRACMRPPLAPSPGSAFVGAQRVHVIVGRGHPSEEPLDILGGGLVQRRGSRGQTAIADPEREILEEERIAQGGFNADVAGDPREHQRADPSFA